MAEFVVIFGCVKSVLVKILQCLLLWPRTRCHLGRGAVYVQLFIAVR